MLSKNISLLHEDKTKEVVSKGLYDKEVFAKIEIIKQEREAIEKEIERLNSKKK